VSPLSVGTPKAEDNAFHLPLANEPSEEYTATTP
jgi:hypothetical protein